MKWFILVFKKAFDFSSRSRRKEYWMFTLVSLIISFVLGFIDGFAGLELAEDVGILGTIYGLLILIPGLSLAVRRLHDVGKSGWWILIALIPIIGAIILLVFAVQDSEPQPNQYGPNPKAA